MASIHDLQAILAQLNQPAFLVQSGRILAVNEGAKQHLAEENMAVDEGTVPDYALFSSTDDGCLYTTVTLGGTVCSCCVIRLQEQDLFILEESATQSELQALALAAEHLRMPLAEMAVTLDQLPDCEDACRCKLNHNLFRLHRIVGNMSDAAYISTALPKKTTCDIAAVTKEVLEKADTLLSGCGVQLLWQLPNQPVYCAVDQLLYTRAVYNLLSNAVKFSSAGSCVRVTLTFDGKGICLTVQDKNGKFDEAVRSTVFTRYKRQPGIEDPRFGLGLGMTLIHKTAAVHGGTVLIQQSKDTGTQIAMRLPVEKGSACAIRTPILQPDIYGCRDQALVELSDVLPSSLYNF